MYYDQKQQHTYRLGTKYINACLHEGHSCSAPTYHPSAYYTFNFKLNFSVQLFIIMMLFIAHFSDWLMKLA